MTGFSNAFALTEVDAGHLGQAFRIALAEVIPDITDEHLRSALKAYGDHAPVSDALPRSVVARPARR